ncbi:Fur family transcriptional regulator [Leifsonia sp. fls2-241-R2A-40a]|uniref:Fur family transcriptional regulator n=1 Tax=Leifsonia sp. fls2-241-R2A-40a TaxID=3040290 RepID=UPI00254C2C20|nr:Fur family transcriptional regulator [Leifsonia sp. fls2-241-R2A-40a]
MDAARLETALREAGLKATRGRVAVLDALTVRPHADAETVFRSLLSTVPGTSIQNVHNVLGDLTAAGLLRRIEPAGSPALYERRIGDNHHHVVCTGCGAVADVDCVVGHAPCLHPSDAAGFAIDTAEVTFWGLCPSCQKRAAPAEQS